MKEQMERRERNLNKMLKEKGAEFSVSYFHAVKGEAFIIKPSKKEELEISPVLYLEPSWWNLDDEALCNYLEDYFQKGMESMPDKDQLKESLGLTHDYIQENVYPKLQSSGKREIVQENQLISFPYLDMIVTFQIELEQGYLQVTEAFGKMFTVSAEELYKYAVANLKKKYKVESMDQMLREISGEEFEQMEEQGYSSNMFILTNKEMIYGAASIMNPDILKAVQKQVGSEFYIIPSSVHECIIINKEKMQIPTEDMLTTVMNINQTLDKNDFLSDNVYLFSDGKLRNLF